MAELRTAHTADLDIATRKAARALLDNVFDDMADDDWEHALGGVHALVWEGAELIGHASVIQRRLLNGGRALLEFRRGDVSPSIAYVNSFQIELFESIPLDVRWSPDGTLPNALPLDEVARLVEWIDNHDSTSHFGPSMPGDDDLI